MRAIRPAVVDFDDVIVDCMGSVIPFANRRFGTNVQYEKMYTYELWRLFGQALPAMHDMINAFFHSSEHDGVLAMEGVAEGLKYLKEKYGAVDIATARPKIGGPSMLSLLQRHGLMHFIRDTYVSVPKGDVCRKVYASVFIDDAIHNIQAVAAKNPQTSLILMGKPWNKESHEQAVRVPSWRAIIEQGL